MGQLFVRQIPFPLLYYSGSKTSFDGIVLSRRIPLIFNGICGLALRLISPLNQTCAELGSPCGGLPKPAVEGVEGLGIALLLGGFSASTSSK